MAEVGSDYERTVGRVNAARRGQNGHQPGDPVRAAKVILDVVAMHDPPRRLLLGSDAVYLAEQSSRSRAQEASRWAT